MVVVKLKDGTVKAYGQVQRMTITSTDLYLDYVNEIRKADTDSSGTAFWTVTEYVNGNISDVKYVMVDGRKVYESDEEV